MACFIVPTTVGIVTTALRKRFPEQWHIDWLNTMILGCSVAFGVEHYMNGEIVPWPPFLTAMSSPATSATMFAEMAAVGIPITLALILAWIVMVVVYEKVIAVKTTPVRAAGA
jgi:succinate dehydrogenase/fumarate reductase cytochrome b subunit